MGQNKKRYSISLRKEGEEKGERKGGKYLEKENILLGWRRKRREMIGEGFFCGGEEKRRRKIKLCLRMRRKMERENIWRRTFFEEEKKIGEGKGGKYLEKKNTIKRRK